MKLEDNNMGVNDRDIKQTKRIKESIPIENRKQMIKVHSKGKSVHASFKRTMYLG